MSIFDFLLRNWDSVIVITIAVAIIVVLFYRKQYDILETIAFALVTEAERKYGGGAGIAKLAAVIEWIYPKIPAIFRLFVTASHLEKLIDKVLVEAKERWKNNPTLAAYVGLTNETQ